MDDWCLCLVMHFWHAWSWKVVTDDHQLLWLPLYIVQPALVHSSPWFCTLLVHYMACTAAQGSLQNSTSSCLDLAARPRMLPRGLLWVAGYAPAHAACVGSCASGMHCFRSIAMVLEHVCHAMEQVQGFQLQLIFTHSNGYVYAVGMHGCKASSCTSALCIPWSIAETEVRIHATGRLCCIAKARHPALAHLR